jgi:hypothetical protein
VLCLAATQRVGPRHLAAGAVRHRVVRCLMNEELE